jgi:hypothetical protein
LGRGRDAFYKAVEQALEIGNVSVYEAGAWCRLTIATPHTPPIRLAACHKRRRRNGLAGFSADRFILWHIMARTGGRDNYFNMLNFRAIVARQSGRCRAAVSRAVQRFWYGWKM